MTTVEAPRVSPPRERRSGGVPAPPGRYPQAATRRTDALLSAGLATAILAGVAIRCWLILSRDFPLNDGGLFYAMAGDIRHNGYALPVTTTYNGAALPFAYSPLALYAAAVMADLGAPLADALRFLPLLATCLLLGAFVLLARELLATRAEVVAATFAFALIPRSFTWLLMGGGLTRSFGFLFAVLAAWQATRFYKHGGWRHLLAATVLSALTVLSHLGTAPSLVIAMVLLFLVYGRSWPAFLGMVVIALGTALLSAPWWGTVLAHHGLDTFRAANATGESLFSDYNGRHRVLMSLANFGVTKTGEPMAPIVWLFALVGGMAAVVRGSWMLPAWWVLLLMFDGRQGGTFATIPLSMLAGIGVVGVVLPALMAAAPDPRRRRVAKAMAALLLATLVVYSGAWGLTRDQDYGGEGWTLEALTFAQREAMSWLRDATPPRSRVLVVSGTWWPMDRTSEWLPVLADRPSVATVQGYEWVPGGVFDARLRQYEAVQTCGGQGVRCLERWIANTGSTVDYLFIPRIRPQPCCRKLLEELAVNPRWTRVFSNTGAIIFQRRPRPASAG